jgi:hypothetical protein
MLKQVRLGLVLTDWEKAAVVRLAEKEGGLSQAAMIRRLIHAEAKRHGIPVSSHQEQPGVSHVVSQ